MSIGSKVLGGQDQTGAIKGEVVWPADADAHSPADADFSISGPMARRYRIPSCGEVGQ